MPYWIERANLAAAFGWVGIFKVGPGLEFKSLAMA
jgi:hypothetical protein